MEYLTRISPPPVFLSFRHRRFRHANSVFVTTLLILSLFTTTISCVKIDDAPDEGHPVNQVSIEDFIDLDDLVPSNAVVSNQDREDQIVLGKGILQDTTEVKPEIVADDEDLMASGSGSGSGDFELSSLDLGVDPGVMTPTKGVKISGPQSEAEPVLVTISDGDVTSETGGSRDIGENDIVSVRSLDPLDKRSRSDPILPEANIDTFDEDSVYDLAASGSSNSNSNNIINPASWLPWSPWQIVGSSAKVRVRNCQIGGQEVSDSLCEGVRVQMRVCTDAAADDCGPVEDVRTGLSDMCSQQQQQQRQHIDDGIVKATSPDPSATTSIPSSPSLRTRPSEPSCEYTLYDTYRHKYVFMRWNLTQVMSQSKLKKWCDKTSGQFIVLTTPTRTCRRLYKDLCQAAQKCRSSKPARERGDFAEGCWRGLVYGDMLPVGLSNKQTIIYFICQRFAADSAIGRSFGYKETHFGTLYDTQLRSPVLSLHKMVQVGDETWPESNYFIEHGLVEEEKNMLWLFRRPRKGMLTLADLDRCYDDQACEVGLRQVLPADYDLTDQTRYTPTPLVWPEWMSPSPASRLSTFTLTNTAPMLTSLFDEWHAKVLSMRKYAIQECGVPFDAMPNLNHVAQMSARRSNKAALYIASGVVPTQNPSKAIGRDVNVPFLFWMAGCCVQQHTLTNTTKSDINNKKDSRDSAQSYFVSDETNMVTNITAFSLYVQNTEGNHVIVAPVLQLELLLQDIYKVKPSDPEVTLFPGQESVCSELQNDVSRWFQ